MTFMAHRSPGKIAQFGRRVLGVSDPDDRSAALEGIARLKDFYRSLGLPVTFAELGVESPDIDLLVAKLHENKGTEIGGYMRLRAADTREIYTLAL